MSAREQPRFSKRWKTAIASFACSEVSSRWPVMAASSASTAVSASRVSPTTITSGSCRKSDRSACANPRPAEGFTCTWTTPGSRYSMGSSTIRMLVSGRVILRSLSSE